MRGIILAAGRGGRLAGITGSRPKCLARLGAQTLIERQIAALRASGIRDITVVTGYGSAEVRRVCGSGIEFVHNARHASTNSLCSLFIARTALSEGFVVLNCDVLFHQQLLEDLLTARYDDALLLAARTDDASYSEEEMKVRVRRGRRLSFPRPSTACRCVPPSAAHRRSGRSSDRRGAAGETGRRS